MVVVEAEHTNQHAIRTEEPHASVQLTEDGAPVERRGPSTVALPGRAPPDVALAR